MSTRETEDHNGFPYRMPFGKHVGQLIKQVPTDYLEFIAKENYGTHIVGFPAKLLEELERRRTAEKEFRDAERDTRDEKRKRAWADDWQTEEGARWARGWDSATQGGFDDQSDAYRYAQAQTQTKDKPKPGPQYCGTCQNSGKWAGGPDGYCKDCEKGRNMRTEYLAIKVEHYRRELAQWIAKDRAGYGGGTPAGNAKASKEVTKANVLECVSASRKVLARKYHPDADPSHKDGKKMQEINAACDWIEKCANNLPQ